MPNERTLRLIFKRRHELDGEAGNIRFSGYDFFREDGSRLDVSVERLCKIGVYTLVGRKNLGERQLVALTVRPVGGLEDDLPDVPKGVRTRRFYLQRTGEQGVIHLFNGSPTEMTFTHGVDDPRVLDWIGLTETRDGGQFWFDMIARTLPSEAQIPYAQHRLVS